MANSILVNYSVPDYFLERIKESEELMDKDPEFQKALKNLSARYNKKNKHNKLKTAKFRYLHAFYQKYRRKELKNVQTSVVNS